MLGRLQPIRTNAAGELYASGEIAKVFTKSLSAPGTPDTDLKSALADYGMEDETASTYENGVRGGSLLVFVRTADEREEEVKEAFVDASGKNIASFRG